jgi:hypothetical protein
VSSSKLPLQTTKVESFWRPLGTSVEICQTWWWMPIIPTLGSQSRRISSERPVLATEWVPGQLELHRKTLSQNNKQNKRKQNKKRQNRTHASEEWKTWLIHTLMFICPWFKAASSMGVNSFFRAALWAGGADNSGRDSIQAKWLKYLEGGPV